MDKIGIVGNSYPLILVAGNKNVDESTLIALAESKGIRREQIEVVSEEEFVIGSKELEQTYVITPRPEIPTPIPDICIEDSSFGVNKHKLRTYTQSDVIGYCKKIDKRRKKNKNKKTHRRK